MCLKYPFKIALIYKFKYWMHQVCFLMQVLLCLIWSDLLVILHPLHKYVIPLLTPLDCRLIFLFNKQQCTTMHPCRLYLRVLVYAWLHFPYLTHPSTSLVTRTLIANLAYLPQFNPKGDRSTGWQLSSPCHRLLLLRWRVSQANKQTHNWTHLWSTLVYVIIGGELWHRSTIISIPQNI